MARVSDLLARRSSDTFVGRSSELAAMLACLEPQGPLVLYLHGIGGIGKSALLDAFCNDARKRQATVVRIDCRAVEPTERGVLQELRSALGATARQIMELVARQGAMLLSLGFVAGALVTRAIASVIRSRWNGMPAPNIVAWLCAAAVLALAMVIACWMPARRAGRIDPVIALRAE